MDIIPHNGYFLVRDLQKATVRDSGLEVPDTVNSQDRAAKAEVVAFSQRDEKADFYFDASGFSVGDTVLYKAFAVRQRIEVNGEELWFLNPADILGIIKKV